MNRIPRRDAVRGLAVLVLVLVHNTDIYPSLHLGLIAAKGWESLSKNSLELDFSAENELMQTDCLGCFV